MAKLKTESAETKTAGDLRPGSNSMMQLLSFVERWERLQEERAALGDDQKEVMAEAKGMGFDTSTLRKVIARRRMDTADRQEADAMLELYEDTIRQAEKQQVAKSIAEGSDPAPAPQATTPAEKPNGDAFLNGITQPRRKWGQKKEPAPAQTDVETWPDDAQVQAQAAAEIGHAADHPEKEPGEIPSFLRRS